MEICAQSIPLFLSLRALNRHNFQEDSLTGIDSSMDISTEENLKKLVEIGENLLKKPVSRINLETGVHEQVEYGVTNEEALKRFICHLKCRNSHHNNVV